MSRKRYKKNTAVLFFLSILFVVPDTHSMGNYSTVDNNTPQTQQQNVAIATPRRIKKIIVMGNNLVPDDAITNRLTFKEKELFDPRKTGPSIKNLYKLGRLRNITIQAEHIGTDEIIIYIFVEEKTLIKEVIFRGNSAISEKDIRKKINFDDMRGLDEQELKKFIRAIKRLYLDKGFHRVVIDARMEIDKQNKAQAIFTIKENNRSLVKRILFEGNEHIRSKELRSILFTHEDWIGSMLDKTGIYQPDRLEADKHMIEQFYQNQGFLNAHIIDIKQNMDQYGNFIITFVIQEGDLYTIKRINAPGNDVLPEEYLLARIGIRPGYLYSRQMIVDTIKMLEFIWGDLGYLFAHIEPSIIPNDEDKTVSLTFHSELGNQVTLNEINIKGNHKTKDKIIRRQILLDEGSLITNSKMEITKARIESLGYFDQRDGVNWKIKRIDKDIADLDLMVKEAKTGNASIQVSFGGSEHTIQSPLSGVAFEGNISDRNLLGTGIRLNLTGKLSKDEQNVLFNVTQPWLFDRPIHLSLDAYHRRLGYEEFNHTRPVNETHTGGSITTGMMTSWNHQLLRDIFFRTTVGGDHVRYESMPSASVFSLDGTQRTLAEQQYNTILTRLFEPGNYVWLALHAGQEKKNHPIHPSRGLGWLSRAQCAIPSLGSNIGFLKFDIDTHWYTPIIGERDLVLHLHGYVGLIHLFKNRAIPYRELFHIGGPASVRGFLFGQLGPQFNAGGTSDSIGGKKALFVNVELIFPITPDLNMKGLLFYDGGTGWDTPFRCDITQNFLKNNSFHYRHAVGVGIRLLSPVPLSVDWGFKIDPRKGETSSEVHFNMSYGW
ncbi:outer membrane protein assembly factor BamA [Candidatus Dependentiae bacterium]|nr:outer membrane protein assembly factor BamA [Candidatus Dependentiae bacterium]